MKDIYGNDLNIDEEEPQNASNDNCSEKSKENNQSQSEIEKEDFNTQEEDSCEQSENDEEENKPSTDLVTQYSSLYTPPYYSPNFDSGNSTNNESLNTPKKQPKNNNNFLGKVIIIASAVIISMMIMLVLGVFLFGGSGIFKLFNLGNAADLGDEQFDIIQNSPEIKFTTNDDPEYVPQTLPEVVNKIGSSVVEIRTESVVSDRFYGQYVTSGAGSGVIVSQSQNLGCLITNYHVIYDDKDHVADTIIVALTSGEEYEATVVGSDKNLDLAVMLITKKAEENFTVANFGDSSKLVVGQDVIAIGNPLGSLGGTVTDGIISALDRQVKIDNTTMVLLQHNAAINPGNSGGGLFDMMGNLVGIVNAKTSETGIEGLGFAIPSNIVLNFFNRVMVTEPAIGIKVAYGKRNSVVGVYVVETSNSDFKKYDRIYKVNGQAVVTSADYYTILDSCKSGEEIKISVIRDKKIIDIKVKIP